LYVPPTSTLFPYTTLFRSDLLDDVHPLDHSTEGGESLAIRVAFAAEVQLRLIADADEEIRCRGVGPIASHRQGTVLVEQFGVARDRKSTRLNSSHLVISYA